MWRILFALIFFATMSSAQVLRPSLTVGGLRAKGQTVLDSTFTLQHLASEIVAARQWQLKNDTVVIRGDSGYFRLGLVTPDSGQVLVANKRHIFLPITPPWGTSTFIGVTVGGVTDSSRLVFKDTLYTQIIKHGDTVLVVTRGDTTLNYNRFISFVWRYQTQTDSVFFVNVPTNWVGDSVQVIRVGGTSATLALYRNRSGTVLSMLSSNPTTTTSLATASGLQNATLQRNDQLWVACAAVAGTPSEIVLQFYYHRVAP